MCREGSSTFIRPNINLGGLSLSLSLSLSIYISLSLYISLSYSLYLSCSLYLPISACTRISGNPERAPLPVKTIIQIVLC